MSTQDYASSACTMAVGRYFTADGKRRLLPYSALELERSRRAMVRVLSTFHFRAGSNVLVTGLMDEGAQLMGAERAVMSYGMVVVSADSSPFDAGRVESILRRFELVAAIGITEATLDGLERLGHDPARLFADKIVWARPAAYQRLAALPGLKVYRWMEIGPAVALECREGAGVHIDRFEWTVDEVDGEVVLSSRLERAHEFERLHTGVHGHVVHGVCKCGNPDPRVVTGD
ncbi:hypothetical protein [Massilia putida]|uniref:hypothetical protein n=1 Tax=Massilia putida TaxID=1141883 RepID=UPI0012EC0975|nr:hypothetical protein [Massilia putida]